MVADEPKTWGSALLRLNPMFGLFAPISETRISEIGQSGRRSAKERTETALVDESPPADMPGFSPQKRRE
jgi:hypothetical protein